MTEEEAIRHLNNVLRWEGSVTDTEALKIAIEALKKQIPKKPIMERDPLLYHGYWNCPTCDSRFGDGCNENIEKYKLNHCHVCGQAIGWGEGE